MLGASALTTLGALPPFLVGSQAVLMMPDLGFGVAGVGVVVSVFFAAAALCTILGAGLLERWSPRTGRLYAGALVASGGLAVAFLVHDLVGLIVAMAVLGAANAACQGTSNKAVASLLPPGRRGLGFGIKQAAVPTAIMLGGLAVPTTTAFLGWRSTFVITGTVGLILLVLAMLRPHPAGAGGSPVGTVAGSQARRSPAPRAAPDHAPWKPLILCALAIAFASMSCNFLGAYLASWAHQVGLTIEQAGWLMAGGSSTSVIMRVVAGFRADRRYGGNLSVVAVMILGGGVAMFFIGWLAVPWAVIVFGILAFAIGWSWPGLMLFAVARVGRDMPTQASSIVQAGAFAGGAVGPALLGFVIQGFGFAVAWWAAGVFFLIAAVLTVVARWGFRRDLERRPPAQEFFYGGGRDRPRRVVGGG